MTTMLCKIESWCNGLTFNDTDREENRIVNTIPYARREARKLAAKLSRENPKRDYAISTYNPEFGWVNYDIFRNGYEI